jgi:hypothetical protein
VSWQGLDVLLHLWLLPSSRAIVLANHLSRLLPLYLVDDILGEWLSLCKWRRPRVLRVASSSRSRNGGANGRRNGPRWQAWADQPKPISARLSRPSHTWVLLPFYNLPPSLASFWRHHPRVQDRGSSRMKLGLLRFNPRGCSFVTLRSSLPFGVISSCT